MTYNPAQAFHLPWLPNGMYGITDIATGTVYRYSLHTVATGQLVGQRIIKYYEGGGRTRPLGYATLLQDGRVWIWRSHQPATEKWKWIGQQVFERLAEQALATDMENGSATISNLTMGFMAAMALDPDSIAPEVDRLYTTLKVTHLEPCCRNCNVPLRRQRYLTQDELLCNTCILLDMRSEEPNLGWVDASTLADTQTQVSRRAAMYQTMTGHPASGQPCPADGCLHPNFSLSREMFRHLADQAHARCGHCNSWFTSRGALRTHVAAAHVDYTLDEGQMPIGNTWRLTRRRDERPASESPLRDAVQQLRLQRQQPVGLTQMVEQAVVEPRPSQLNPDIVQ